MDSLSASATAPPAPTFPQHGFTLTEMAVVLVIVALLIGSMILPLSAQRDIRAASEAQQQMNNLTDALYGFAATHTANDGKPYLPCPANTGDGTETRRNNICVDASENPIQEGDIPWATLGFGRQDAWGNALRYRVSAGYSNSATGFRLLSMGDLRICADATDCATTVIASAAPAVILSRGKNGTAAPADNDELENADNDNDFVQHAATTTFDDIVVWLPSGILINRMITAGRLP